MIGAKKFVVWIWNLINMEGGWKGIFVCCGFICEDRNAWVEKIRYFFFFLGF
jgi:hypothetical protein